MKLAVVIKMPVDQLTKWFVAYFILLSIIFLYIYIIIIYLKINNMFYIIIYYRI